MLVSKSQPTIDGTRVVKIVCLLLCYTIGFMECKKDTLKTSDSMSDMSAKILIITSRLVRMIPGIEIIGRLFPDSR